METQTTQVMAIGCSPLTEGKALLQKTVHIFHPTQRSCAGAVLEPSPLTTVFTASEGALHAARGEGRHQTSRKSCLLR